ncbi:hypothetical protein [Erwinia pyrifoliae]|uniref:Uncharacterized protein n=1 Tax=Erwinia pyrifoliae TaxID=79967 RepID=A0ABY5X976_ERWPY|nr:hypothetical protein [Erwinia pyrifoliae]MCA8875202.1 hypothetical protein [Erwinia pyrifoliae]MCT2385479.1 hypothetical protein [Erwinia pyrifoliae]MCU8588948.1 hypothetical protein [Erwinia pyrifoliae]UWS29292.1 hypothetical protein NYP81_15545 [Erwinia pyrifoliae]UWS33593.1 hypothetical protein NYP84_18910 [Erwinia pyrifoliae]
MGIREISSSEVDLVSGAGNAFVDGVKGFESISCIASLYNNTHDWRFEVATNYYLRGSMVQYLNDMGLDGHKVLNNWAVVHAPQHA